MIQATRTSLPLSRSDQDSGSPDSLATRVQALERRLVPEAIRLIAEGRVVHEGTRVRIKLSSSGS